MPYLHTVPPEDAAGEVKAIYDQDMAARGYVANYARAFSGRPEVYAGWLALKDAITSQMDPRLYELVTVAAATARPARWPTPTCMTYRIGCGTPSQWAGRSLRNHHLWP